MKRNLIQGWKFWGMSAGFHGALAGVILLGMNWVGTPLSEFSNAIIVDLVRTGEAEKEKPAETRKGEATKIPASRKLTPPETETAAVPEENPLLNSGSVVQKPEPFIRRAAVRETPAPVLAEEQTEEPPVERLVLARIPRSALPGILGEVPPPPGAWGEEGDEAPASSSEELNRFLSEIRARLEEAKRYPLMARIRGQEGVVQIAFRINGAGKVEDIHLVRSSEWPVLNREAFKTVSRVGHFGYPPGEWKEGIEVKVPLAFRLEDP